MNKYIPVNVKWLMPDKLSATLVVPDTPDVQPTGSA